MGKRIGVIGDLHGRGWWKDFVKIHDVDYWVFLGDYTDSYTYKNVDIIHNLKEVIRFKEENPKTILLIGNHDFPYMFGSSGVSNDYNVSGHRPEVFWDLNDLFTTYKDLFQFAHADSGYLFTHAGVVNKWWKKYKPLYQDVYERYFGETEEDIVELLNITSYKNDLLYAMWEVGKGRTNCLTRGNYGSPIWADQQETRSGCLRGFNHIVGHTPQVKNIGKQYKFEEDQYIMYCDTMSDKEGRSICYILTVD